MEFLAEVLRAPFATGAIAPSSSRLAAKVVQAGRVAEARSIIELGAGTGALTRRILAARDSRASVLLVERNSRFSKQLREKYPAADVACACASRLTSITRSTPFESADCIVSALPWSNLPAPTRERILDEVCRHLAPNGVFVFVQCLGLHLLPAGRDVRGSLHRRFRVVEPPRPVLANFPPALLCVCRESIAIESSKPHSTHTPSPIANREMHSAAPPPYSKILY